MIAGTYQAAQAHQDAIADVGVSYDDAMETLDAQGVEKFTTSWDELLELVSAALPATRYSAEPTGTR